MKPNTQAVKIAMKLLRVIETRLQFCDRCKSAKSALIHSDDIAPRAETITWADLRVLAEAVKKGSE